MQENNFINSALKVIQIEGKAILGLQDQIKETFNDLCSNILATKGKLILMGIGKSGHIAQKISATLSSTGTPSFFIHPTEAAHGDLGMIDKKDAILILSNSGETKGDDLRIVLKVGDTNGEFDVSFVTTKNSGLKAIFNKEYYLIEYIE